MSPRIIEVRQRILKKNDELAREMRTEFGRCGVYVVNLVSGPGAGKTELLKQTLLALKATYRTAAVVGDLATENDARRLSASGAPVKQILTGTTCHLDAEMVRGAIREWKLDELDFLFIENVGNLVCPSSWDLGEDLRGLLFAVTEGEDKPLKYPTLINTADVVLLSKMDLAAAVDCDLAVVWQNVELARPGVEILQVSARTGSGMAEWIDFLRQRFQLKRNSQMTVGDIAPGQGSRGNERGELEDIPSDTSEEKIYIG